MYTTDLSHDECSIRVYRSFIVIVHKWMNTAINVFYIFLIMLNAFDDQLCWHNRRVPIASYVCEVLICGNSARCNGLTDYIFTVMLNIIITKISTDQ